MKINVWTEGRRVQMQLFQNVRSNRSGEGQWKLDGLRVDIPGRVDDLATTEASDASIGMLMRVNVL